jgi:hypothetical protein
MVYRAGVGVGVGVCSCQQVYVCRLNCLRQLFVSWATKTIQVLNWPLEFHQLSGHISTFQLAYMSSTYN